MLAHVAGAATMHSVPPDASAREVFGRRFLQESPERVDADGRSQHHHRMGLGEFGAALMVAGATRMKTETLPLSLYLNMSCGDLPLAIAAATLLIVTSLLSLYLFERFSGGSRVV